MKTNNGGQKKQYTFGLDQWNNFFYARKEENTKDRILRK
ncbi:MAG: hypothetical protein PG981_000070 [Wolbachia endosymbiont of Ctenocephalides orientis wCori]|nr:MAG: hypothetical protein PG981_000070 [Wolbachia endosymbiont of Ctenocephalides orientis wCori]